MTSPETHSELRGRKRGGNPPSRRRIHLSGVVALLVIGVAVYALTQGGDGSALNPIAQAAVRSQHAPGARTSFRGTVSGQSLPHPIEMNGRGLFNGTTNRSLLTMSLTGLPGHRIEMEGVGSGSHFYYRSDQLTAALPDGDEWLGLDMTLGSPSETGAVASASPSGQLAVLRAASDKFERLGEKRIRGVKTTGYRSSLDPERFAEYLRGKGSTKAAGEYEQLAKTVPSATELETWIDANHLVRQIVLKAHSHEPGSGKTIVTEMTVDFYHYGISPEIQLPSSDTVYDATPKLRSELGLGGS